MAVLVRDLARKEKALSESSSAFGVVGKSSGALGAQTRRIPLPDRQEAAGLRHQANGNVVGLTVTVREIGISERTYERWQRAAGVKIQMNHTSPEEIISAVLFDKRITR